MRWENFQRRSEEARGGTLPYGMISRRQVKSQRWGAVPEHGPGGGGGKIVGIVFGGAFVA